MDRLPTCSITSSRIKSSVGESDDDVFSSALMFSSSKQNKNTHLVNSHKSLPSNGSCPRIRKLVPKVSFSSTCSDPSAYVVTPQTSKLDVCLINSCPADKLKFPLLRTKTYASVSSTSTGTNTPTSRKTRSRRVWSIRVMY